jgi:ribonuclease-3
MSDGHVEETNLAGRSGVYFDAAASAALPEPCPHCVEHMAGLEAAIEYVFEDKRLLFKALTHSSYAHENVREGVRHNERIEYLGDAVLALVLADYLFRRFPERWEGDLTLMRSWLVSESSLAEVAQEVNLSYYLLLGSGEDISGGRERAALQADAFESLIGSIYLDGGYEAVAEVVLRLFADKLMTVDSDKERINVKNELQAKLSALPEYVVIDERGPEHMKEFEVEVRTSGTCLGSGAGSTKKEAEMRAAEAALAALEDREAL